MGYVYGLYSSLDGVIRYVGKTNGKPRHRLSQHLTGGIGQKKDDWIDEVYSAGGEVLIVVLEEAESSGRGVCAREALYREGYWICGLNIRGNELVNSSPVSTEVLYRLYDEYELKVKLTEREEVLVKSIEEFCGG